MGQQAGEQRGVHLRRLGRLAVQRELERLGDLAHLADQVLPFAYPQVVEVFVLAQAPELVAGQLLALVDEIAPQVEQRHEVRVRVGEAGVRLGRLGLLVDGPLARVLDGQRGRDHDDLVEAAVAVGLQHHAGQPRVDRQLRELAADLRKALVLQGAQLMQQRHAVGDVALLGRVEEREVGDLAQLQRGHLQDDAGQVGAQDLRVGELRPVFEVLLVVEADADAVRRTAAAALALVGRRLRDGLDRQALHLKPVAVAGDARRARVDDVLDARNGQRRLRDVRGEHDPPARVRLEHAMLLGRR